jgi:hypothetical protein
MTQNLVTLPSALRGLIASFLPNPMILRRVAKSAVVDVTLESFYREIWTKCLKQLDLKKAIQSIQERNLSSNQERVLALYSMLITNQSVAIPPCPATSYVFDPDRLAMIEKQITAKKENPDKMCRYYTARYLP